MDHFTLSLAVGAVAGALDVIPMIFQNLSARSCFSAFFIYFFAAVIVFYSDLPYCTVTPAVARAAIESGVARQPITDWDAYIEKLRTMTEI